MFIEFSTTGPTSIEQLREDVLTEGRGWEADAWNGILPSVYLYAPDKTTHFPRWVECCRGTDGILVEIRVNLADVRIETGATRFETIYGARYAGECFAIWVTATSRYVYRLVDYHLFGSGDKTTAFQRWEYEGSTKGFRSQDLLPDAIKGSYPSSIFVASGTYGHFNPMNAGGGCPLAAYQAAKAAWEAPFVALTGLDTGAAAESWKAREGLMSEPATLETLFRGLKEKKAADRRRLRQLRKEQATANPLPSESLPETV